MKIRDIRATALVGRSSETGWEEDVEENIHTLVEVFTDEGLTGVGSAYTSFALVEGALRLLRPWCIGQSAIEPERLAEHLHQTSFWQGRGGSVTHAISAIDIALWDLFGQATGQPVARLLGGYHRDRIKAYASVLFEEPGRLHDKLQRIAGQGFRAIKMGWGKFGRIDRAYDELLVRTARDAVGPDVELMVDAGASESFWPHSYKWAIECARMLAEYDVVWFEEALRPDAIEDFIRLREHAPLPISSGEVLTRRQSFLPWLERGAVDIIQPDSTKVGGLSEARRIGWAAYDHDILLVSHGWNTAIGLAADLHLAASLPIARWVEYLTPTPLIDGLVTTPFQLDGDGMLAIPTAPGLGITLDPEGLEKYAQRV
jgi:L-alanine-DL-glutamate epimerase-like enolase superfamily enzyme